MREAGRGRASITYVLLVLRQAVVGALGELGDLFQEHLGGLLGLGGQLRDDVLLELTTLCWVEGERVRVGRLR